MKININNSPLEINEAATVADALALAAIDTKGIAVAVNESVVPKSKYGETVLRDGDNILIIKAFYGG